MDPLDTVDVHHDTTYVMMREAERRGHDVFHCQVSDLTRVGLHTHAAGRRVAVEDGLRAGPAERLDFDSLELVFMRKDPPFDIDYVFATYQLDGVDPERTWVLNRPDGLRAANEKCFIQDFPALIPDTIVTMQASEIRAFMSEHDGRCIIKPLDGMGGLGIFMLSENDPNLSSLIETSTNRGRQFVTCQRYLPRAVEGDKRIVLIGGEPVGAVLRVPAPGELRGNMAAGASSVKTEVTPREREICAALKPRLDELGLVFVGIDVIGDYLTEVNVTSPTGAQEINELDDVSVEAMLWDYIEEHR